MLAADSSYAPGVGILILIGLVVAILLWQKLVSKAKNTATRAVFRGSHKQGQALVRGRMEFHAPVATADVISRVVTAVNAHDAAPAVVPGLYLSGRTTNHVQFTFGSKLDDVFVAQVRCHAGVAGGVQGSFDINSWTESEGIVAHRREISRLRERVAAAVIALGGTTAIDEERRTTT